jgi:dimethylhistidine N-methyltransferase
VSTRIARGRPTYLFDRQRAVGSLCDDVRLGLAESPRKLPPKHFYDDAGALLFERITQLDEYYPTRVETGILRRHAAEMARLIGPRVRLVEFGSGSGAKTRIVLEQLEQPTSYVPIDISHRQLLAFADSVSADFPAIAVLPVNADYTSAVQLPADQQARRTVAFFPGSTIGNFEPDEAEVFLRHVAGLCGPGGQLLIGADLHKDRQVLEQAYNDAQGVTAAFNLNLLGRINRECGANFDSAGFRHHAFYDEQRHRIEMRLVCTRGQQVSLPAGGGSTAATFEFYPGDYIITEYSHKYTTAAFASLVARAGWQATRVWTDEHHWFAVWLLARN